MSLPAATIRLSKMHYPVTVLGPGRRIGIWLQGCDIGCPGCISRDTWDAHAGEIHEVDAVLNWCRRVASQACDGVTISGGEPFQQGDALRALLVGLDAWRSELEQPFDILCYSGYPLGRLERRFPRVLSLLDAVISEPFVLSKAPGKMWRGSANQTLVPLSALGRSRYAACIDAELHGRQIQFSLSDDAVWFIGIPGPGDFERMEESVGRHGVLLEKRSWRA